MPSKRHEPDIDTYAIGSADSLEADYVGGTYTIQFDLKQVRENNFIRYYIEEFGHGLYFDTPEISENDHPGQCFVNDIDRRVDVEIRAFFIPEYVADSFKDVRGYEILYTPR